MILDLAHQHLRWPSRDQVLKPSGAGPSVYARLANEKVARALRRLPGGPGVEVGILAAAPSADATEAPLAVVCEFNRPATEQAIRETHRLTWSFSRSRLLITLEPQAIRAWTCCEPPRPSGLLGPTAPEINDARIDLCADGSIPRQAADALSWLNLVSGEFFRQHDDRFRRDQCADQLLLDNLKTVREKLKAQRLDYDTAHDLLARLIFIQFLCDRADSGGKPALGPPELQRLHKRGVLSEPYTELADILESRDDTYALFRWLNESFNGDLFPGKGTTLEQREAEWQAEMQRVKPRHLQTLAQFVSGKMEMRGGQGRLWREYAFDTIPLEFISSIYEEFVSKRGGSKGAHYTPAHLVDFMLDRVLPWDSDEWDLKVLDPACGSGIFLVKAYQRLIYRWKNANPGQEPKAEILKRLLTRNLFGVDKDPHAVRVASFSMYLAMCDEIDPRHYWTQVQFPRLRGERLIAADFFREDQPGFRTDRDREQYDMVVGNAPWGERTETALAREWRGNHGWVAADGNVGPLFLAKGARLVGTGKHVSMIQPSGLIFHTSGPSCEVRERVFSQFKVDEVVNLSALRFGLFKGALSPACIITMRATSPDGEPLLYMSPKPAVGSEDDYCVVIEPHDIHLIAPHEALHGTDIWTTLMWGGRRDLALIHRLRRAESIGRLERRHQALASRGLIRGNRKREYRPTRGRPILETEQFPPHTLVHIAPSDLPANEDIRFERPRTRKFDAFASPQLIVKQGWTVSEARFRAVVNSSAEPSDGALCSDSYVSIHAHSESLPHLEAACLSYNSLLSVYFLFLTSDRLATYRPAVTQRQLLDVPIPEPGLDPLANLTTFEEIDERVRRLFAFRPSEWALIKDLVQYTFTDFKGDASSPGRQPTRRGAEPDLKAYARSFAGVLRAGFGEDKRVCTTVFQETNRSRLPIRLAAVHLGWPESDAFRIEPLPQSKLRSRLEELNKKFLATPAGRDGGIFYQRVARVYDTVTRRGVNVPTVYLIKPDRLRYWTRSAAMRDADEVAADLMSWRHGADAASPTTAEHRIA